jgi:hypothetical protein
MNLLSIYFYALFYSSFIGPNIMIILFSYVLIFCSSSKLRGHIPDPYEITDENAVSVLLYILTYIVGR